MRRTIALVLVLAAAVSVQASKRRAAAPGGRCSPGGHLEIFTRASGVVIDQTYVYYHEGFSNTIRRVPKSGGESTALASLGSGQGFRSMIVDDTGIYIMTFEVPPGIPSTLPPSSLYSVPKTGGTPLLLTTNILFPVALRTDATHIYWVSVGTVSFSGIAGDGKVERMAKNGTARVALADDLSGPLGLVLDGNDVIFTETGLSDVPKFPGIRRVPKDGGPITDVRGGTIALSLEMDGGDLYFAGGDRDSDSPGILRMPKDGGDPTVIIQNEPLVAGPIVHGGQIYYVTEDEDQKTFLRAVPITGGGSRLLAKGPIETDSIAVDDCYVYYSSFGTLSYVRR